MSRARALPILLAILAVPLAARYKPWYVYNNFNFGAKALSMGNAFTAVADDASAAFWNPAGLARIGALEFQLSYRASRQSHVYDSQTVEYAGSPETQDTFDYQFTSKVNGFDFFALNVPATFWGLPWGFAISYNRAIPYGFQGSKVEISRSVRSDKESQTVNTWNFSGSEGLDTLGFSAACQVGEGFSFGLTLQQYFNSGMLHYHNVKGATITDQEYVEKMEGRSFILGVLFMPVPTVTVGLAYHTAADVTLPSTMASSKTDAKGLVTDQKSASCRARIHLPAMFSLGLQVRPMPALTLSADFAKIYWAHAQITGYYGQTAPLAYPVGNDFPFAQSNVANLSVGAEWNLPFHGRTMHLRGGWFAERQLFSDVLGGPVTTHGYSLGAGSELSAGLRIELVFRVQRAIWLESGHFDAAVPISTRFRGDTFNLSLIYRFRSLFQSEE